MESIGYLYYFCKARWAGCVSVCSFMVRLRKNNDAVALGENKCPKPGPNCSAGHSR